MAEAALPAEPPGGRGTPEVFVDGSDRERIDRLFAALDRVVDELMLEELEAALRRARRALDVDA